MNNNDDSEPTAYQVLGVENDSTTEKIRAAYKRLALKHHPDKGGDAEKFRSIYSAHKILTNAEARQNYDDMLEARTVMDMPGPSAYMLDVLDALTKLFVSKRTVNEPSKAQRFEIDIPLGDMYQGGTKNIQVNRSVACPPCIRSVPCTACGGKGKVRTSFNLFRCVSLSADSECYACSGRGISTPCVPNTSCSSCMGTGHLCETLDLELNIPRGCPDGKTFLFERMGDMHDLSRKPKDLLVSVYSDNELNMKRVGDDLCVDVDITLTESLCGFEVGIPHPNGKRLVMEFGESIVRDGESIRVPNKGMPVMTPPDDTTNNSAATTYGDLLLRMTVIMPVDIDRSHSEALRRALDSVCIYDDE